MSRSRSRKSCKTQPFGLLLVCLFESESIWKLNLVAIDPQGNNTLKSEASSGIYRAGDSTGDPVQTLTLSCDAGDLFLWTLMMAYASSILCADACRLGLSFLDQG